MPEQQKPLFGFCLLVFLIGVMVCFVPMIVVVGREANELATMRKQAIDLGYAEHDRKTGRWQWVEAAEGR